MDTSLDMNDLLGKNQDFRTQFNLEKPDLSGYLDAMPDVAKSNCDEFLSSYDPYGDFRGGGGKKPVAKSDGTYLHRTAKNTATVSLSNLFLGDQFRLLKIVPVLLKYLLHDPAGIKLIKANKATLTKEKLVSLTKLPKQHIEHFWRLVVPAKKRKHPNLHRMHLLDDLVNIRDMLWRCKDLHSMWIREDKKLLLKNKGYTSNEAKTLLSLLTPERHKASGKTSKSDLLAFKEEIEQIDLSWTEDTTPFS